MWPNVWCRGRDHKLTGVCTNWPIQNYKESQEIRGTPRWAESRAPASFMRSLLQSRDHLVVLRTLGTLILSISPHFIIPWLGSATKISIFWLKEDLPWLIWENRVVMVLGVSCALSQSSLALGKSCWLRITIQQTTRECDQIFWGM